MFSDDRRPNFESLTFIFLYSSSARKRKKTFHRIKIFLRRIQYSFKMKIFYSQDI